MKQIQKGGQTMKKIIVVAFLIIVLSTYSVAFGANWYVDNQAAGVNNGTSWANAWTSFAKIAWGATGVKAGDTLYISGGSTSKTYNEQLKPNANGSSGAPITIKAGQDYGHSGVVTIRSPQSSGGIFINRSYITVNGNYNNLQHIRVTGSTSHGVYVYDKPHHVVVTYLEIDNNGSVTGNNGIKINNSNVIDTPLLEISYCKVHNNWQDQIGGGWSSKKEFGRVLIHHNEIYELQDDGIETRGVGCDIYENIMHDLSSGKGKGHPDGFVIMGNYGRMWNNIAYNLQNDINYTNAYFYINPWNDVPYGVENILVYNNLAYQTIPTRTGDYARGFEFSAQGTPISISNVLIANNTFVGMPAWGANLIFFNLDAASVKNVYFLNNIIYNCYRLSGGSVMIFGTGAYTVGSYGDNVSVVVDYNIINKGPTGKDNVNFKGKSLAHTNFKTNSATQKNITGNPDPKLDSQYRPTISASAASLSSFISTYQADKIIKSTFSPGATPVIATVASTSTGTSGTSTGTSATTTTAPSMTIPTVTTTTAPTVTTTTAPTVTTTTAPTVTTTTAPTVTTTTAPKVTTTTTTKPKSTRGGWTIK